MQIKNVSQWNLQCIMVYHPLYSSAQTKLLMSTAVSHLLGLKPLGFCYTLNTGTAPGLLSDILLLRCVMELQQLCVYKARTFTCSISSYMVQMLGGPT